MSEKLLATIELIERYAITINGRRVDGFKRDGRLEGMTCYRNADGLAVVVNEDGGDQLLQSIFGKSVDLDVIKASPELIGKATRA